VVIAENAAKREWQIDLVAYKLIEKSQEIRPGGLTIVYKLLLSRAPNLTTVIEGYDILIFAFIRIAVYIFTRMGNRCSH
jgi:hypothetical protein